MKTGELVRSILFPIIGAILMFWVQPTLYQSRSIRIADLQDKVDAWVGNYYMTGALVVFAASVVALLAWFLGNHFSKAHRTDEVERWHVVWYGIGIIPLVSILIAVFFFRGTDGAWPSLIAFFGVDVVLLYWGTTVSSTAFPFTYIPPLSKQIRGMIGG